MENNLSLGGNQVADSFVGMLYMNGCPIESKVCPTVHAVKDSSINTLTQKPITYIDTPVIRDVLNPLFSMTQTATKFIGRNIIMYIQLK